VKRDKTKKVLLSLTREQANEIGIRVEALIKSDLNYIVNKYVRQYQVAAEDTFGWTKDDLMQHIRIILWKGLATFDESKKFKVTTYLSTILYYQMGNFSKACQSTKNSSSKLYCPETIYPNEDMVDHQTAEDWYSYAQSFGILMGKINELEKQVLVCHLINGDSLVEMEKKIKSPRSEIISVIKGLKQKINDHLKED
jgi:DNA-directed RNA polymerase specialized sigma24 family protein